MANNNVWASASNAAKITLGVLVVGGAIAVGKSATIWGIVFLSATYLSYVLLLSIIGGISAFFATLFARKKMQDEGWEPPVAPQPQPRGRGPLAEDIMETVMGGARGHSAASSTSHVDTAAEALAKLTPDEAQELWARLAALQTGKGDDKPVGRGRTQG